MSRPRWMARHGCPLLAVCLTGVAVLIRVNNGIRYPSLNGYDSFGHLTYVFYLLKAGRVPFADQGWSFFHPPLYHALAAAIWTALSWLEPKQILKAISVTFSLVGLGSAWVSYEIARRYFRADRVARFLAPTFVLFLPVGLYTAPMFGNEGLNTVLCSVALYALIGTLRRPQPRQAVGLGLVLGLALLTKATAVAAVAAAVLSLAAWTLRTRRWRIGGTNLLLVAGAVMLVCGWYYARNVARFGTPFVMSRNYLVVAHVENALASGKRGPLAYLSFDPESFVTPRFRTQPVIDSVWAGAFGGTWFEMVGESFVPPVLEHAGARWTGRLLLVLGVIPTLICLLGMATGVYRLLRYGWDETLVAVLSLFIAMLALFVVYTRQVPTFSAVKASYLLPALVPFSIWFALGMQFLRRWRALLRVVFVECSVLLALIVPVFTYQLVFAADLTGFYWNAFAVTYYLAGFRDAAKEVLTPVARGYHFAVAHENLAAIAMDDGRPDLALAELEQAMQLAPEQVFATGADHAMMATLIRAEYESTAAVLYDAMGRGDLSMDAARRACELAPEMPEAHYNMAALLLRDGAVDAASGEADRAVRLDPTFTEAQALWGISEARRGNCERAVASLRQAAGVAHPQRAYPWETGRGDLLDAGLARRRIIPLCRHGLDPYAAMRVCAAEAAQSGWRLPWLPPAACAAADAQR